MDWQGHKTFARERRSHERGLLGIVQGDLSMFTGEGSFKIRLRLSATREAGRMY